MNKLKATALALAALAPLASASCARGPVAVKGPLVSYGAPARGRWKDGECWIEGRRTLAYSYGKGEGADVRRWALNGEFPPAGERLNPRVPEPLRCGEGWTFMLTGKSFVMLPGAGTVYFGREREVVVESGTINASHYMKGLVDWLPLPDSVLYLRPSQEKGKEGQAVVSRVFYEKKPTTTTTLGMLLVGGARMAFRNGIVLIAQPAKEYLFAYSLDGGGEGVFSEPAAPRGTVSFANDPASTHGDMFLRIGERAYKLYFPDDGDPRRMGAAVWK